MTSLTFEARMQFVEDWIAMERELVEESEPYTDQQELEDRMWLHCLDDHHFLYEMACQLDL